MGQGSEALEEIPVVDLAELVHPEEKTRRRAATTLHRAFAQYGLVYLMSHGVDFALRDRLFDGFTRFTDRSVEEKQPLNRGDIWFQRGWTPANTERAVKGGGQPDFKECYFAAPNALDRACQLQYPEIYAENVWPEGIEGFAEDYVAFGRQLHEAGLSVLSGIAMALDLPSRSFERKLEGAAHVLRLLRYLPLDEASVKAGVLWGEEHTDFNLLTLLGGGRFYDPSGEPCANPDPESGLFLTARGGERVRGVAPPGCIVAQVGQALEILTGGELLATPHVIVAPRTPGYTRLSAAHFVHLHAHEVLLPLSRYRSDEALLRYRPPVLAGTYAMKTLVDIGLAPASALDGLGYRGPGE